MVYSPDTTDEIQSSLIERLSNKIDKLTNFVNGSFNEVWTRSFSERLRDNQEALLAVQLSGWVEYAGGPITQDDLESLGVGGVDVEAVNKYMNDSDLDELVKIVGISRDMGETASGEVTVTVSSSSITVPEGTEFGTEPDNTGEYLSYITTEAASPATGESTVTIPVEASEAGSEYNVGSNQVTYLTNPPTGVEGVTNQEAISGGVDPETNDELRARAKDAVLENSGGGTVRGIEGYIETNVEGVITVEVEEFPDSSPPYADVVVDGGNQQEVLDAIDMSHPSGVKHNLVRPTEYTVDVVATVSGGISETDTTETLVTNYINDLQLGEDLYRDKIIQRIMNSSDNIDNISSLQIRISDEPHDFVSGTNVYNLDKNLEDDDGSLSREMGIVSVDGVSGGTATTFTEDTDYREWNSTSGDTSYPGHDSIDWSLSGAVPDGGSTFYVDYVVPEDITIDPREKAAPGNINITIQ